LNTGFAAVFAEDVPDVPSQDITPPDWDELCPRYASFIKNQGGG